MAENKEPAVLKDFEWITLKDDRGISIPARVIFLGLLPKPHEEGGELIQVKAVPWCAILALDPCVRIWYRDDDKGGIARLDRVKPFPFND